VNILVTGASGFIGSELVRELAGRGHSVTALVHKNNLAVPGARVVRGDVSDAGLSIEGSFDLAYHLAAVTPLEKDKKVQQRVNLGGAVNLFERIRERTRNIVYASGLGVFGSVPGQLIDETTAKNPDTHFARIRLEAERHLEKGCREHSIGFSVAYLGEVYGNGGWFASHVVERLRAGKFRMPKSGDYLRSFVHVEDAARALAAIGEGRPHNESFIVADSQPALFRDFVNYAADRLGVRHAGSAPGFVAKMILGGDALKLLTTPTRASNKKISGLVELRYPTYREGLAQVLAGA